jgi:MFS family permease
VKRFKRWLKRIRGALGIGALGAIAFNLVGWAIVGVEALTTGALPTLTTIARMSMFTLSVGGFAGIVTAGAIALGAGSSRLISRRRAFLLGLPLGAVAGLLISLSAASLPVSALLLNAAAFGLGTGALGAGAVTIAERSSPDRLEPSEQRPELLGDS